MSLTRRCNGGAGRTQYLKFGLTVAIFLAIGGCNSMKQEVDSMTEKTEIEKVIKSSITWAVNKDKDRMFLLFVNDSTLFYFSPDNASNVRGFEDFKEQVEQVFMNPAFKAIRSDFRDLQIEVSRSGECAWWSCYLDDINEWNGQPASWINVRWTGVLEKRDDNWIIVQMHFSHSLEDMQAAIRKAVDDAKTGK